MSRDAVLPPPPPPAAAPLAGAGGRSSIVMVPGASANLASFAACRREREAPGHTIPEAAKRNKNKGKGWAGDEARRNGSVRGRHVRLRGGHVKRNQPRENIEHDQKKKTSERSETKQKKAKEDTLGRCAGIAQALRRRSIVYIPSQTKAKKKETGRKSRLKAKKISRPPLGACRRWAPQQV